MQESTGGFRVNPTPETRTSPPHLKVVNRAVTGRAPGETAAKLGIESRARSFWRGQEINQGSRQQRDNIYARVYIKAST